MIMIKIVINNAYVTGAKEIPFVQTVQTELEYHSFVRAQTHHCGE